MLNYSSYKMICLLGVLGALSILWRVNWNMGSERQVKLFRRVLVLYIVYTGSNFLWAMGESRTIPFSVPANYILNCLIFASISVMMYCWFSYCVATIHKENDYSRRLKIASMIPMFISIIMSIASLWTHHLFYVTSYNYYLVGRLYNVKMMLDYFYVVVVTIYALLSAYRSTNHRERMVCLNMAWFIFVPIGTILLNRFVPEEPAMEAVAFFSILWIFLNMQDMRVYNDALTGMNNRRRLDEYIGDRVQTIPRVGPFYVFLVDINDFKQINDRKGHVSGDRALVLIAQAMKKSSGQWGGFAARFGGDEFVLICDARNGDPQVIIQSMKDDLKEVLKGDPDMASWGLSISVGYTTVSSPDEDGRQILTRADRMLYEEKHVFHGGRMR